MATDFLGTIRQALVKLNSEKGRIDRQISALKTALSGLDGRRQSTGARGVRRTMSAAARKAIGKRMKAYWAKRRATSRSKTTRSQSKSKSK